MSTTKLDFTNASSLRSGASALLIGSQSLLQDTFQTSRASTATLDTFKPLLQPVLSGQTKVNSAWNEGYSAVALLGDERTRNMGQIRADLIPSLLSQLPKDQDAAVTILLPSVEALVPVTSAVSKAFPLYSRKSSGTGTDRTVNLSFVTPAEQKIEIPQEALKNAQNLSDSVRLAQRLVDTPTIELSTTAFLEEAQQIANKLGDQVKFTAITGEDLAKKGMGGIYNVGKCSTTPPAFILLQYTPSNPAANKNKLAMVAKGIVYDSGGLSLKSGAGMSGMKSDMAGAAGVLAAFQLLVQSGYSAPLDAILCVAENCIGPNALRNDDIITSYSGKTTEINNTDAEGRLVLSDGVAYASKELGATHIVDLASLTGAQMVCTGNAHAAVLSNDADFESLVYKAGQTSGDFAFPILYAPEVLMKEFDSKVADMRNSVANRMNAQASCAGHYIGAHIDEEWMKTGKWAHIDAAGPTWVDQRGTGFGPALLAEIARKILL